MLLLYALLTIFAIIVGVKIRLYSKKVSKNRKLLQNVPCPPERLFFGHLYIFLISPDKVFAKFRECAKNYPPIYRFSTLYINTVNFMDPNDIELILTSSKCQSKSKLYSYLENWLGTGLLTSRGAKYHKRRKILTPAFHFSILQEFLNIFNNETGKFVEKLNKNRDKIIDVVPPVANFTLQTILRTSMGLNMDECTQKDYTGAIHEIGKIFIKRVQKQWYRFESIYKLSRLAKKETEVVKVLHDFSNTIIRERERKRISDSLEFCGAKKRPAMLDLLLSAKNEGADIDYEGIREEVDTFTFEGHDTVALAFSYLLLVLANFQDIQAKVLDEILSVLGPSKIPSYEDLQELKYTERCIKETLRLFPSVPLISRYAGGEFTTKTGHTIPKGTVLHIHIFDLHRNEKIYPDPEKFDPDRFLPENIAQRHPFAYIPFSAGPRNCIGQKFAMLELKAVVCGVLRKFKLEKVDDLKDLEFRADLVLRPVKGLKVKILERKL